MEKIDFNSKFYPETLKNIKNPPKILYSIGNLDLLNTNSISIIGSRACSMNGFASAKNFASNLVHQNITITSGMAVGIDTAAHTGALEAHGNTIAVLGCGFDNIFPKENIKLFHNIINENGLVISEYPPQTTASSKNFLERNRIVSGLSIGILIIEASHRSGTSVTCKFAREQNRKIFCIPHDLSDVHGVGTNQFIKKGAYLVTSVKDIIDSFEFLKYKTANHDEIQSIPIKIKPEYLDVYNVLVGPPLNINQICDKLNKPVDVINNALFMLELDGIILKTPYGYQVNERTICI